MTKEKSKNYVEAGSGYGFDHIYNDFSLAASTAGPKLETWGCRLGQGRLGDKHRHVGPADPYSPALRIYYMIRSLALFRMLLLA